MKNKNKIQKQLSNKKKRKAFLILGASILAAASVAIPTSLILTNNKSSSVVQITFNGNFEKNNKSVPFTVKKGTTLEDLLKDNKKANAIKTADLSQGIFCGWSLSSNFKDGKITLDSAHPENQIQSAHQTINESISLTAIYTKNVTNYDELKWVQLKFLPDEENKATIAGNVLLEVPIGDGSGFIHFQDINRPSVTPPTGSNFLGWSPDGTQENIITGETIISSSMTLYPCLTPAEIITFHPGSDAEIESGSAEVPIVGTDVKFGDINAPKIKWTGSGTKYFAGWYSQNGEGSTWDESKLYTNTTPISKSCHAYARWVSDDDESFTKMIALVPDGETAEGFYDSNTTFMVKKDTPWKDFNHPNPTTKTKEVTGWKYSTDYDPVAKTGTWNDVDPNSTTFNTSPTYVMPTLETAIKDMQLIVAGQTSAIEPTFEQNQILSVQAFTFPESLKQDIATWEVYKQNASGEYTEKCTNDEVSIIPDGTDKSKATIQIKSADINSAEIKAFSSIDTSKFAQRKIFKLDPYTKKMDFFTNINGISYNLLGIDDKYSSNITLTSVDGKTVKETVSKTSFNYPIFIGDHISEIPNGFLANCTAFNNTITQSPNGQKITSIGNNFMLNCNAFNQSCIQPLIENATSIGSHFMENCVAFEGVGDLTFAAVQSIGDNFMYNDIVFQHALYFKGSETNAESNLTSIGNYFLYNCSMFNSTIELPASLQYLGCGCMHGCDAFTNEIVVNCDVSGDGFDKGVEMFATMNSSSETIVSGFQFNGIHSQEAIAAWPTVLDGTKSSGNLRNSKEFDKEIDNIKVDASKPPQLSYVANSSSFNMKDMGIVITYKDGTTRKVSWDGTGECPWTSSIVQGGTVGGEGTEIVTFTYTSPTGAYSKTVTQPIYKYNPTSVANCAYMETTKGSTIARTGWCNNNEKLQWSLTGITDDWNDVPFEGSTLPSFWPRAKVFLRGYNPNGWNAQGEMKINIQGEVTLGGKSTALINNGAAWSDTDRLPNYAFYGMFGTDGIYERPGNTSITKIEAGFFNAKLAHQSATECLAYSDMFKYCKGLKQVDAKIELTDAIGGGAFNRMFEGCENLETVPDDMIASVKSAGPSCFRSMFKKCTSLKKFNSVISVSDLSNDNCCLEMFNGCTGLTTVADDMIKAAGKVGQCCFKQMFMNCTSLTKFNSIISATNLSALQCCYSMFDNCSLLEAVPTNMLDACVSVGTESLRSMFWCCSSITQIPMHLNATTSANYCYAYMFQSCKALKVAPQIALKNAISSYCCCLMFSGCESLKVNNTGSGTAFCSFDRIEGDAPVNDMFGGTGGSYTTNPQIGQTYYFD